jgi:membrane protein implicated in regulation of membrane protease activity
MDWLRMWEVWLGLAIVLGIAEMFSLDLILAMLAIGAFAGLLTGALGAPVVFQMLAAAAVSVATLAFVRPPIVKRLHSGPDLKLGHGKLVGQQGVVTERITGLEVGRIKIGGEVWSAAPYDESLTIAPGETVEVLSIKGATAYVHPVPSIES